MNWKLMKISSDSSHHTDIDGTPAYNERFDEVLKFHAPGLAPVMRDHKAWHIFPDGSPAYERRFSRTFGFYDETLAAVQDHHVWFHITSDGQPAYPERFAWCGNFQEGRCTVRQFDGSYYHISADGCPAYSKCWCYVGDFRDGVAVVQAQDGYSTHIDLAGRLVHGQWFLDLDVYHKGYARARDRVGWMHIDLAGKPMYRRRFAAVEPFYNGQARVEQFGGRLLIIDELGEELLELRSTQPSCGWNEKRLGNWPIEEELYRGSHGAVYISSNTAVIKSTSNLHAWAKEGELLQLLEGNGVPKLLDMFTRSGTGYLVLERLHGTSLGSRRQTKPRDIHTAIRIILDLLQPLSILHQAGWIHTDIHPENVIETANAPFLIDFANAVRLEHNGTWAGEVHWGRWELIPPEQFEGFTTLDQSTDTYALCALLAYLVQGTSPFAVDVATLRPQGWSAVRAAFQGLRITPRLQNIPISLQEILLQGLAVDTTKRFKNAFEFIKILEDYNV